MCSNSTTPKTTQDKSDASTGRDSPPCTCSVRPIHSIRFSTSSSHSTEKNIEEKALDCVHLLVVITKGEPNADKSTLNPDVRGPATLTESATIVGRVTNSSSRVALSDLQWCKPPHLLTLPTMSQTNKDRQPLLSTEAPLPSYSTDVARTENDDQVVDGTEAGQVPQDVKEQRTKSNNWLLVLWLGLFIAALVVIVLFIIGFLRSANQDVSHLCYLSAFEETCCLSLPC